MEKDWALEVYRQRYETYRHLDRLRWHIFQIAIASSSLALVFARARDGDMPAALTPWLLLVVGVLLGTSGGVMLRIGRGIEKNAVALRQAAAIVGDNGIPATSNKWKSISFQIALALIIVGSVLFCTGLASVVGSISIII